MTRSPPPKGWVHRLSGRVQGSGRTHANQSSLWDHMFARWPSSSSSSPSWPAVVAVVVVVAAAAVVVAAAVAVVVVVAVVPRCRRRRQRRRSWARPAPRPYCIGRAPAINLRALSLSLD